MCTVAHKQCQLVIVPVGTFTCVHACMCEDKQQAIIKTNLFFIKKKPTKALKEKSFLHILIFLFFKKYIGCSQTVQLRTNIPTSAL